MEKETAAPQGARISARDMALCAMFTALIAIGAFIKIPIPYIAFSLQTLFVSLAGMLLGPRLGLLSVGCYVALGLLGLPIFTQGGGIGYVLQPSFGFLIGFFFYAYLTGFFTQRLKRRTFGRLLVCQLPGLFLMYAIALPYFFFMSKYFSTNPITVSSLFIYCFLAMLPGEALKCSLAAWVDIKIGNRK